MAAPNPDGKNQFAGFGIDAPYGDVAKQTELLREAPISGAPISGRALGTPDRIRQQRQRGRSTKGGSKGTVQAPPGPLPIPYEQQMAMIWQQIAAHPGASDLVKQIADRAMNG